MEELRCPLCQRLCNELKDVKVYCYESGDYRSVVVVMCLSCFDLQKKVKKK